MLVYEKNSGWKVGPVSEGENIVTLTPDMVTEIFFFIMSKPVDRIRRLIIKLQDQR